MKKPELPTLNRAALPYAGREALDAEVARRAALADSCHPEPILDAEPQPVAPVDKAGIERAIEAIFSKVKHRMDPEEARRHRFQTMIAPRMAGIGFPKRYLVEVGEWEQSKQESVFEFCRGRFTQIGSIVALVGERGVGKTFIASQLCRDRIDKWLAYYETDTADRPARAPLTIGRYLKLTDLIARFKPLYADFGSIEIERLMSEREELCRQSLLCLDEIHECDDQRLKGRVLTDFLDRRYSNRVDTLMISNETDAAFRQSIGDSALSRIEEHGEIVTCCWESWRTGK